MEDKIIQITVDSHEDGCVYGLSESGKTYRMKWAKDKGNYWELLVPSPHDGKEQGK